MPLENIAWAVQGGITSSSLGRMVAYQATGGEEGVAGIGDWVVRQTAVASGSVRVGPGGGVFINRYPGILNESYMARAGDETLVAIPQNAGTTTRYDMLIARIDDWNMPGGQAVPASLPTDEVSTVKFQVITGVSAAVTRAKDLNLNYPAIALARIAIPAATAAVTQAMITDLREKAVPRRKRDLRPLSLVMGQEDTLDVTTAWPGAGESWPNQTFMVEVPDWAAEVSVVANWNGVLMPPGGCKGGVWAKLGHGRADYQVTQVTYYDSTKGTAGDYARVTLGVADTIAIPPTMRGQSISCGLVGNVAAGTPAANIAKLDSASSVYLDLEFIEAATEDL